MAVICKLERERINEENKFNILRHELNEEFYVIMNEFRVNELKIFREYINNINEINNKIFKQQLMLDKLNKECIQNNDISIKCENNSNDKKNIDIKNGSIISNDIKNTNNNNIKRHFCDHPGCNKSYKNIGSLNLHKNVHDKYLARVCDICGKKFSCDSMLIRHINSHYGIKLFKCKYKGCNKKYTTNCALVVHLRSHSNERFEIIPHLLIQFILINQY